MKWQDFVLEHAQGLRHDATAHIVGVTEQEVRQIRYQAGASNCRRLERFAEVFKLWHGRDPQDSDWPVPRREGSSRCYQWHPPELALLVSQIGLLGPNEIATLLTHRLRKVTGDPRAARSRSAVMVRIQQLGLQVSDLQGAITVAEAAHQLRGRTPIDKAIKRGELVARRVGKYLALDLRSWKAWLEKRDIAPPGSVRLSTLKGPLGIKSDKLSEWARAGLIPDTVRVNLCGDGPTTQFGTWFILETTAKRLIADRAAGRPMPWAGKPYASNLATTWALYSKRRHHESCPDCSRIWSGLPAPRNLEEFSERYPPLTLSAKRHLTSNLSRGFTVMAAASYASCKTADVSAALRKGLLKRTRGRITLAELQAWMGKGRPTGRTPLQWIAEETAMQRYGVTRQELRQIQEITSRESNGVREYSRVQCAEHFGPDYTRIRAARVLGVTPHKLDALCNGLEWQRHDIVTQSMMIQLRRRMEHSQGDTPTSAAKRLSVPLASVQAAIDEGVIEPLRSSHDAALLIITPPMLRVLRAHLRKPSLPKPPPGLTLMEASRHAGVSTATLLKWCNDGEVRYRGAQPGRVYDPASVEARAREYWANARSGRQYDKRRPSWISAPETSRA